MDCNLDAVDISSDALTLAQSNASRNNVEINFIESDLEVSQEAIWKDFKEVNLEKIKGPIFIRF